jgi:hypothetical protein
MDSTPLVWSLRLGWLMVTQPGIGPLECLTYPEVEFARSMRESWMVGSDQLAMEENVLIVELLGQCVETVEL